MSSFFPDSTGVGGSSSQASLTWIPPEGAAVEFFFALLPVALGSLPESITRLNDAFTQALRMLGDVFVAEKAHLQKRLLLNERRQRRRAICCHILRWQKSPLRPPLLGIPRLAPTGFLLRRGRAPTQTLIYPLHGN